MRTLTWESPDKKYLVMFKEDTGVMKAHRYGEAWRDLNGDGMVLSMLHDLVNKRSEIDYLREQNKRLVEELNAGKDI